MENNRLHKKERRNYIRITRSNEHSAVMLEKRHYIRLPLACSFEYVVCAPTVHDGRAEAINVSHTGIQFSTHEALAPGTIVALRIDFSFLESFVTKTDILRDEHDEILGKVMRAEMSSHDNQYVVAIAFFGKGL